jgi:hypothetical protein
MSVDSGAGEVYAIYLPYGGEPVLEMKDYAGVDFTVDWFDPRSGGGLTAGGRVTGGSHQARLGAPPRDAEEDWAVLVRVWSSVTPARSSFRTIVERFTLAAQAILSDVLATCGHLIIAPAFECRAPPTRYQ